MPRPRKELVSIDDTPYYHVVSRCVRRTFLCGVDHTTGNSYEHRRQWIENRIRILSSLFSIDICAYAVLSNHYHIALKLCPEQAEAWTSREVAERWTSLFKGPLLVQQWVAGKTLGPAELLTVNDCIAVYRKRLADLSWFMKCLNEPIAREANKEDQCTGHFWQARFTSQALLTEQAVLSCMTYIDLNPIRAGMAKTPEDSDHTSIKERITPQFNLREAIREQIDQQCLQRFDIPLKPLARFEGGVTANTQTGILFSFEDYLELVDFTGRIIRKGKRGVIAQHLPPILKRLNINQKQWLANTTNFEAIYHQKFGKRRDHLANTG